MNGLVYCSSLQRPKHCHFGQRRLCGGKRRGGWARAVQWVLQNPWGPVSALKRPNNFSKHIKNQGMHTGMPIGFWKTVCLFQRFLDYWTPMPLAFWESNKRSPAWSRGKNLFGACCQQGAKIQTRAFVLGQSWVPRRVAGWKKGQLGIRLNRLAKENHFT